MTCPLCSSAAQVRVDEVAWDALVAAYALPSLGVPVAHLAPDAIRHITLWECSDCGLRWYDPPVAGDAAFYEALQRHDWYYMPDKAEFEFAAARVPAGSRVLEVGCGRGLFAQRLAAGCTFRGLEYNAKAVQAARAGGLDVEMCSVQSEAAARPGAYDVVCHFQVLEHVQDVRGFLSACVAALRPGGLLIVAVPSEDSFLGIVESGWLNMPPHHLTRWPDRTLRQIAQLFSLSLAEIWHEPLAAVHEAWYRSTLVRSALLSSLGTEPRLVARRGPVAWALRTARHAGLEPALLRRGEGAFAHAGRGHTVCAVYTRAWQ
jgi:2-polyprenyl-3-methyl-5-hydroxy-6-metoxy-1,4-benzoquinol methylase